MKSTLEALRRLMAVGCIGCLSCAHAPPSAPTGAEASVVADPAATEPLPDTVRMLLHRRMVQHGNDMTKLMLAVLLLSDDGVVAFASQIAGEMKISRPSAGELDAVNSQVPERFFDFQDQLQLHARSAARAAKAHDRPEIMRAYFSLSATCVACHQSYLVKNDD